MSKMSRVRQSGERAVGGIRSEGAKASDIGAVTVNFSRFEAALYKAMSKAKGQSPKDDELRTFLVDISHQLEPLTAAIYEKLGLSADDARQATKPSLLRALMTRVPQSEAQESEE